MFGLTKDIGNDMTTPPPPRDSGVPPRDTEDDRRTVDRPSVSKKAWTKPTIVRIDDGLTLVASGPTPDAHNENQFYFIQS